MTSLFNDGYIIKMIKSSKDVSIYFRSVLVNGILELTQHRALAFTLFEYELVLDAVHVLSASHKEFSTTLEALTKEDIKQDAKFFRQLSKKHIDLTSMDIF